MTGLDTLAQPVVALSLFFLMLFGCTTDKAAPETKSEISSEPKADGPAPEPKANEPGPAPEADKPEPPPKAVEPEPEPAVDNQAARQKHGLGKRPKDEPWSPLHPGLTAFEALTALCLDYKLAADVAVERSTDEWTAYVAKRKGMKTERLAKVYAVWMAYALGDQGADPSGPELAYCTWD